MGQGLPSGFPPKETESEPDVGKQVVVIHCPNCNSYLQPSLNWVKSHLGPEELLNSWVKRFKNPNMVQLLDQKPCRDQGRSKIIGIKIQNKKIAEYIIDEQSCDSCSMPHDWEFAVQLRHSAPHNNALVDLIPRLYNNDQLICVGGIRHCDHGVDFFFKSMHCDHGVDYLPESKYFSMRFVSYLETVLPVMNCSPIRKTIDDSNSNTLKKTIFHVDICPMYLDDLVLVPRKVVDRFGMLSPLAVCLKYNSKITLLDPLTLRWFPSSSRGAPTFTTLFSSSQLVEFKILNVHLINPECPKPEPEYVSANAEVMRVSDSKILTVKTHLGRVLRSGDYALGYDLCGSNVVNEYENLALIPDVILVKKSSDKVVKYRDSDSGHPFAKCQKISSAGRGVEVNKVLYRKRRVKSMYEARWDDFTGDQLEEFLFTEEKASEGV